MRLPEPGQLQKIIMALVILAAVIQVVMLATR